MTPLVKLAFDTNSTLADGSRRYLSSATVLGSPIGLLTENMGRQIIGWTVEILNSVRGCSQTKK